jgi:SH3-like domain-containing protein
MKTSLRFLALIIVFSLAAGCAKKVPPPEPAPAAMPEQTPEPTPESTLEPTPQLPQEEARVLRDNARLRATPSTDAEIVLTYPAGTILKVIAREGDWCRVTDAKGTEGYIFQNLIHIMPPGAKVLPPVNEPQTLLPDLPTYMIIKDVNIRSGPGMQYEPPVGHAKANQSFVADGYTGKWYHGVCDGVTGWIYSGMLDFQGMVELVE